MRLHELSPAEGSTGERFRVGRGHGSGNGKTSGRGHKGQKARSGYSRKRGFEGGQMPLARRLPKRGFVNIFAKPLTGVSLTVLDRFEEGAVVSADALRQAGYLKQCPFGIKILDGELSKKLTVWAAAFSKNAADKIEQAGGQALTTLPLSLFNDFGHGATVTVDTLKKRKLVGENTRAFAVTGEGSLTRKVTIRAGAFSAEALAKISSAGGKAEVV